ncbi:MAG: DUF3486 family protein [Syntrophotalea acetylenica]|uniref:phage protein Gp27 family protein n=1 Tax=Syntrophotalea acetylenica TaxID=29542 RepID=UPI002A35F577|nr:phage protein Gp27 family protein [Syntrophotalea acetylenica]MDD4457662.1 DUF3486 family protein [Syntrophotalea acetylenica]MDY0262023.1 DUF3486 family protein [Syntrophotalea acetylenica]
MPQSNIEKLPLEIKIELKRRLRSGSIDQQDIADWIRSLGYAVSRSALSRYAVKLRQADKGLGIDREILAKQNADAAALFEELAYIKKREDEILAQLKTIMVPVK